MELEQLVVGRLNRVNNKIVTYSGKALNSAIGVKRLGGDSFATGFMYENEGSLFVSNLDKEGVKNSFVWNKGHVRTNYKIVDNRSMLTEINDKGENVTKENQQKLLSLVETLSKNASVVIMSGSLPSGVDEDFYFKLAKSVNKSAKIIVDTEGEKLKKALNANVFMVKPNLRELEQIANKALTSRKDMLLACYSLIDAGAQNVLLSLGREGAILTDGTESYFCKSTSVAVNSTVGAGDSMVAAASVMIEQGESKAEILKNAVAAGTASITTPGTNLFYRDKFEEIYGKISVVKI
jgi:1-phosphofructokinase